MHAGEIGHLREAAIRARNHVLAPDQASQSNDAFGNQFGMLDDVGCMAYHAGDQHRILGQLEVLPQPPFVFVRGLASSIEYPPARTFSTRSAISLNGTSDACGPGQLPQQMWYRIFSRGNPLMAWLMISTCRASQVRYSFRLLGGTI